MYNSRETKLKDKITVNKSKRHLRLDLIPAKEIQKKDKGNKIIFFLLPTPNLTPTPIKHIIAQVLQQHICNINITVHVLQHLQNNSVHVL